MNITIDAVYLAMLQAEINQPRFEATKSKMEEDGNMKLITTPDIHNLNENLKRLEYLRGARNGLIDYYFPKNISHITEERLTLAEATKLHTYSGAPIQEFEVVRAITISPEKWKHCIIHNKRILEGNHRLASFVARKYNGYCMCYILHGT